MIQHNGAPLQYTMVSVFTLHIELKTKLHLIWSLSTKTTILQQLKTVDTAVMQVDVQRICFHEIAMNDA